MSFKWTFFHSLVSPFAKHIVRHRKAIFVHVARLTDDVTAHIRLLQTPVISPSGAPASSGNVGLDARWSKGWTFIAKTSIVPPCRRMAARCSSWSRWWTDGATLRPCRLRWFDNDNNTLYWMSVLMDSTSLGYGYSMVLWLFTFLSLV